MNRFFVCAALLLISHSALIAQNAPPVVAANISDFNAYAGAPNRSIDLTTIFRDPDATNAVRLTTVLGNIDIVLYGNQTPLTVANFLRYINEGRYFITDPTTKQIAPSFIHRAVPNFVIQGGGFLATVNPSNATALFPTAVSTYPPIQNEPGISNKRGTIAMAKIAPQYDANGKLIAGTGPDSATSQWFINLADNGGSPYNLDAQNGGFTVFGRVAGAGMSAVDNIAKLPIRDFSGGDPNNPFNAVPVRNYTYPNALKPENCVTIPSITQIAPLTFTAASDNPAVIDAAISGSSLLVTPKQVGSARVTVTATDLDGASTQLQFTVTVVSAPGRLINISTRLQVGTGDNALIAGFIVRGNATKRLIVRGIGPSLAASNVADPLTDPTLELHDSSNATIAANDNWQDNPNSKDISDTGIAPTLPNESAILTNVTANANGAAYTAILRGVNDKSGVGLGEVYDLDYGPGSTIVNISTRGHVDIGENVMIGGFFLGGSESKNILVRGIGPSLAKAGITGALKDPQLELHNAQGTTIDSNDDWQSNPRKADIQASGIPPSDPKEAAMYDTLAAGAYTAILRGGGDLPTGIGLVEVYQL